MNLDVSPDGKQIAFDLLGDIFVMPIGGGEARQLTDTVAWDMQPRWSPDGQRIAFTSDRGGGDNLWVMGRDGSDPKAVSDESFRTVNAPAWSPDGQFIAGRKHFTKTRSAGSGEIWLWHRDGGKKGLQLTEKPNDQKDVNEPAFSPDGAFLYYSIDSTPGATFEYNKDPTRGIYSVRRVELATGRTEDVINGPGGAVRPTPSHDGRWLAFVRRVDNKSWLHLKDLRSGEISRLHGPIERDMQEIWAMQGVYPSMAWTPDDAALVFWSAGKVWRLELASRKVAEVPFRVRKSMKVFAAQRAPVEVAPDKLHTRMLRGVAVSPKGDRVVYEALGKLWIRALPDGTPKRLTAQDDHFELSPVWSRDGKSIAYVSWDDAELARLRVVAAGGGKGRILTPDPGHYVEPAFSPDGRTLVYRAIAGGSLRAPLWGEETGVFAVPVAGGAPRRVTREGVLPHFGADGGRLFLMRSVASDKRELFSIEMDGSDPVTHLTSEYASEFRVAPDGRWIAWVERFQAYVAPLVATGRAYAVGPKADALPVTRVSKDAGDNLQWSGDSKRLWWSTGPELFQRDLTEAFGWVAGAPAKASDPAALLDRKGIDIGFDFAHAKPKGRLAVVGARLVTMKGDEVIADGTVVVDGNRIVAVGPRATTPVPAGATVIDGKGRTVLPGLVDAHWHGSQGDEEFIPQQNWYNFAALGFGVTTVHDPSNDSSEFFAAAELARSGAIVAPRLFSTGTILYGATTGFTAQIDSVDDARSHLRRLKALGASSVKSYNQPRRDQRQQVLAAARELGMNVVPEGGAMFNANLSMVVDGHTTLEHSLSVENVYDDVVQLWSASAMAYTPTLVVAYGGLWGENYWYDTTEVWKDERLMRFVPRSIVEPRARRRTTAPFEDYNHVAVARGAKRLADAGVTVATGAHGQREGLGLHWEIAMMVQGGMTPHQALRAATLGGAKALGYDKDIGSLEVGKLADLVLVEGDPLKDVAEARRVTHTIVNGRAFDAATMDEVGAETRKRRPFWFERWSATPAAATSAHAED
jgi:imidazolonepropionase-like amidohydrolase/Tol biopolymer transport system component